MPDAATVAAARAGDQHALDALVAGYLPLVYNIVGRALDGHADVDDVVQETMLAVVNGLDKLRDLDSFRSWLVAIAMQKVRERWRHQQARPAPTLLDELLDTADPGADFVDLTIVRLGLSGQRQEVAEATRWLESEEREVLSLWWLEAAGELTREELSTALDLTPAHAAVRVQRVKARLDSARAVVRSLRASPQCPDLAAHTMAWDGRPAALWRKRLARHTRECAVCSAHWRDLAPAEGLLVGMSLVPLPAGLAMSGMAPHVTFGAARHAVRAGRRLGEIAHFIMAKPVAAVTAGTLALGGGAAVGYAVKHGSPSKAVPRVPHTAPAAPGTLSPTRVRRSPHAPRGPRYGQTVDQVDGPQPVGARPAALPVRPEGAALTASGRYASGSPGSYLMTHRGDHLTISGRGYFAVRWQLIYFSRGPGQIQMPTWTGLKGKLFHVASGGGHRMDDTQPGATTRQTWMGDPAKGYDTLPRGAQQMWQNEFFYLNGTVTLNLNEGSTDYNLIVIPKTRTAIVQDISQAPDPAKGPVRYGLVRDTGTDSAPVPQYLTRATPSDPASVPQRSRVS